VCSVEGTFVECKFECVCLSINLSILDWFKLKCVWITFKFKCVRLSLS